MASTSLEIVKLGVEDHEAKLWAVVSNPLRRPAEKDVLEWKKANVAARRLNMWHSEASPSGGAAADKHQVDEIVADTKAAKESAPPGHYPVIMCGLKTFVVNMTLQQMLSYPAFIASAKAANPHFNVNVGWQHWTSVRDGALHNLIVDLAAARAATSAAP